MRRVSVPERGAEALFGTHDENLRFLEEQLKVRIKTHGTELLVEGEAEGEEKAAQVFGQLGDLMKDGYSVASGDVRLAAQLISQDGGVRLKDYLMQSAVRGGKKTVVPRSLNQRAYLEKIATHDMVFGIGPAGTGKTYLAVAQAVASLLNKSVARIVLARPAVEAGEKLGFLPGTQEEKVDPYMLPIWDALNECLGAQEVDRRKERKEIEVAPLAFMRGRTLKNAFVIVDEAQNATVPQMKMVLTRLGRGSRMIVTGDPSQTDLPSGVRSGLAHAIGILKSVKGVALEELTKADVVRHELVGLIVDAYDRDAARGAPKK
jgi:phosphate starvation-inducible PhoH-like protein